MATDDTIHIFVPEYPSPARQSDAAGTSTAHNVTGISRSQFTLSLQVSTRIRPGLDVNRQLFAFQGIRPPPEDGPNEPFVGTGEGSVTQAGSAVFQAVNVEWSPSGLGYNLRPVLTAMLTSGSLVTFGEHVDHQSTMKSGLGSRTFKDWKVLWGLGGLMPLPDTDEGDGCRIMNERITSFSWAREIAPGRALLTYMTEDEDVVIMSVRFAKSTQRKGQTTPQQGWRLEEVARFSGSGPHVVSSHHLLHTTFHNADVA